jgi:hypothetical protein
MVINRFLILFFLLLFLTACKEKTKNNDTVLNWGMLDIEVSDESKTEKIAIFNDKDSCVYSLTIRDKNHFLKYGVYDQKIVHFVLSKEKKSKLYSLFRDLFFNSTPSKDEVSCYSGTDVKFTINQYGNPSLSCRYKSIAKWFEISNSTKEIYELTFKHIYSNKYSSIKCNHIRKNFKFNKN